MFFKSFYQLHIFECSENTNKKVLLVYYFGSFMLSLDIWIFTFNLIYFI